MTEFIIIGNKKYKTEDVQNVLVQRIPSYPVEEIES
jgi:hypothetical protein